MEEKIDAQIFYQYNLLKNNLTQKYINQNKKIQKIVNKYKKLSKDINDIDIFINKNEENKITLYDSDKLTETDRISTSETQNVRKNEFFFTKTEKLLNYNKKQKIGKLLEKEIEEETSNIKLFYDNEIRDKLINKILSGNQIKHIEIEQNNSSFLSLCSFRKEKVEIKNKDDSISSGNKEEESICIVI